MLAIPLAMFTSSDAWGIRICEAGLLRVVEEAAPRP